MLKIKKGDTVRVIAGKDKGKEGKVLSVDKKNNKVLVEGINMITKHTKPSAQNQNGGIINQEDPIDLSNVMYVVKGKTTISKEMKEYLRRCSVTMTERTKYCFELGKKEMQNGSFALGRGGCA